MLDYAVPVIALMIIGGSMATMGMEGLWAASIMLINVIVAGLIAMNFWEPIAAYALQSSPGGEFFWDYFALMGVFAVVLFVLRTITDKISRQPVVFNEHVHLFGGLAVAFVTGWVMVCFLHAALHTAPLPRDFGGCKPEEVNLMFGPDRVWLGFAQQMSLGPFAAIPNSGDPNDPHVFDPRGEFLMKYTAHRVRYADPQSVEAGISGVVMGP